MRGGVEHSLLRVSACRLRFEAIQQDAPFIREVGGAKLRFERHLKGRCGVCGADLRTWGPTRFTGGDGPCGTTHIDTRDPLEKLKGLAAQVCAHCRQWLTGVEQSVFEAELAKVRREVSEDLAQAVEHERHSRDTAAKINRKQSRPIIGVFRRMTDHGARENWQNSAEGWVEIIGQMEAFEGELNSIEDRLTSARNRRQSQIGIKEQARIARRAAITRAHEESQGRRRAAAPGVWEDLEVAPDRLVIRKKDYRRGNTLDNYIRSSWIPRLLEIFDSRCFICRVESSLTLDHLWWPKNSGGNFAMLERESSILISNVLILCQSCNSAKGERAVQDFFDVTQAEKLLRFQRSLSGEMLADSSLCATASGWYGQTVAPIER